MYTSTSPKNTQMTTFESPKMSPKSYQSKMKQNNSTELLSYSLRNQIYPKSAILAGFFIRFYRPCCGSFEEACAMPVIFVTVEESLGDLAKLSRGERVLIHAAAGGTTEKYTQL